MLNQIIVLISLLAVFQIGCSSKGFNRGDLKAQIGVIQPQYNDQEIKEAFQKKSNLPKPFKLGVYFKSPNRTKGMIGDWRWTEQDKAIFEEVAKELKAEGIISDVFPIMGSLVSSEDMKSLRLVAAKHQADALLIIGGAGEIDRYINNWGWSYAFLLPTLFVPGSQADTLFMTHASLWDVRNEFLYLTAEAEATLKNTYVAAFGHQDKELINQAKLESLNNLKVEIKKMLQGKKL